jgi:Zn-finger nucleic acid-binding protein
MYFCPTCKKPLKKSSNQFGIIWVCPECKGRAISLYVLKKALPDKIVKDLWLKAQSGQYEKFRKCPVCGTSLPEVPVVSENQTVFLDVCTKCNLIWFDNREYESLPKTEIPKSQEQALSQKEKEAQIKLKIESIQEVYKNQEKYDFIPDYCTYAILETILEILFFR